MTEPVSNSRLTHFLGIFITHFFFSGYNNEATKSSSMTTKEESKPTEMGNSNSVLHMSVLTSIWDYLCFT